MLHTISSTTEPITPEKFEEFLWVQPILIASMGLIFGVLQSRISIPLSRTAIMGSATIFWITVVSFWLSVVIRFPHANLLYHVITPAVLLVFTVPIASFLKQRPT